MVLDSLCLPQKVWINSAGTSERMPMWCPPTPPSSDGDVYCETWARALYRRGAAADSLLPPVRWRDSRAARSPRRVRPPPRAAPAPPSLFERAGPRPRPRPRASVPTHRDAPPPEWSPCEDAALRRALRLQRLPPDPPAARAPNWDWLADLVNDAARLYRSPRACRDRHDTLMDPERARRKHRKPPPARRRADDDAPRPPLQRLDAMRDAAERRRAAPKRRHDDAAHRNPKHAALLADHGVDYDTPPTPMEVATRRADRIAKEKQKAGASGATTASSAPPPAPTAPPVPTASQRIVVAAHPASGASASVGGGAVGGGKPEAVRRARAVPGPGGDGARVATPPATQLLYRQQPLASRHHLKILHHPGAPQSQGNAVTASGLQLQQLALRRTAPRASVPAAPHVATSTSHAAHVVLAHLPPAAHGQHAPHVPDNQQ